ncbi:hypothetical protein SAMN02745945_01603 [Peptoclostridium litorale DSM 5388]|uniref:HEAT repeats family protein n=1 Tax=Peptoclostridium litorale DSM 5388 TaxID=1121324 RepID=A0A069RJ29_PEPLI|nr:HEAT repeat domain-containing protein [Peptoclostridium litorale]KDR96120.1 HEAT repeats family protein [Peptoclostridium litorale DSM 5388]SIO04210.1 hypothetical protein SAMN02745945_01603 [Peptoclostridium litorale DSM 5388]
MHIIWEDIESLDDFFITYMLYKEGKTASQISLIRGMDVGRVKMDIIKAKQHINMMKSKSDGHQKPQDMIENLLKADKQARLSIISELGEDEILDLKRLIFKRTGTEKNAEDLMILLWTCGELGDEKLLPKVHEKSNHTHGGVRRMAYSAMGKIGSNKSLEFLHRGLFDEKPQARQYAINAISKIASPKSIPLLQRIVEKKGEKEYVTRAALNAIEEIQGTGEE